MHPQFLFPAMLLSVALTLFPYSSLRTRWARFMAPLAIEAAR